MVGVSAVSIRSLAEALGWDLKTIDRWLVHSVVLVGQLFGEFLDAVEWSVVDGHPYSYEVGEALNYIDSVLLPGSVSFNPEFVKFVKGLSAGEIAELGDFIFKCVYSGDVVDCDREFPEGLYKFKDFVIQRVEKMRMGLDDYFV